MARKINPKSFRQRALAQGIHRSTLRYREGTEEYKERRRKQILASYYRHREKRIKEMRAYHNNLKK